MSKKIIQYIIYILWNIALLFFAFLFLNAYIIWKKTHIISSFVLFITYLVLLIITYIIGSFLIKEHTEVQNINIDYNSFDYIKMKEKYELLNKKKINNCELSEYQDIIKDKKEHNIITILETERIDINTVKIIKKEILKQRMFELTKIFSSVEYNFYFICITKKSPKERHLKKLSSKVLWFRKYGIPAGWSILLFICIDDEKICIPRFEYNKKALTSYFENKIDFIIEDLEYINTFKLK